MTSENASLLGFLVGVVGITLVGALGGGVGLLAPCHGRFPTSPAEAFQGAWFGGLALLILLGLPAGFVGSWMGCVLVPKIEYDQTDIDIDIEPSPHPLEDWDARR